MQEETLIYGQLNQPIDLVYKIGGKCEWTDYEELRLSLRSVAQNLKGYRNIFIVGYKPSWLKNVIHIPATDPYYSNKDANLINKMILACQDYRLSYNFLNISDDMFFLKEVDIKWFNVARYNDKLIKYMKDGEHLTKWEQRLEKTVHTLQSESKTAHCFEAHIPYLLNRFEYPRILFRYDYGFENGYCGNTLYFNNLANKYEISKIANPIREEIVRIDHVTQTVEEITNLCSDRLLINYTIRSLVDPLKSYLSAKFLLKSQYEIE